MFLFRKNKSVQPSVLPKSPHPLRGWTNLGLFEVRGQNPSTGRQNKRIIEALTADDALSKARLVEKLLDPITVEEIQRPMATERQIAYGASIGVYITEADGPDCLHQHDIYRRSHYLPGFQSITRV